MALWIHNDWYCLYCVRPYKYIDTSYVFRTCTSSPAQMLVQTYWLNISIVTMELLNPVKLDPQGESSREYSWSSCQGWLHLKSDTIMDSVTIIICTVCWCPITSILIQMRGHDILIITGLSAPISKGLESSWCHILLAIAIVVIQLRASLLAVATIILQHNARYYHC